jgi:hypothetical protein
MLKDAKNFQGINTAFDMKAITGAVDMLQSPLNTQGVEILKLDSDMGHIKQARIRYAQRHKKANVGSSAINICAAGEEPLYKEKTVDIDSTVAYGNIDFSADVVRQMCNDPKMWMQENLQSAVNAATEKLNDDIIAKLELAAGVNYSVDGKVNAGTSREINLLTSAGDPNYKGWVKIKQDFKNNQLKGTPMIIGNGNWDTYIELSQAACCNSAIPFNQAILATGAAYFQDQSIDTIIGANEGLVLAPGAAQLVTFNRNTIKLAMFNDAKNYNGFYLDPNTGLNWDLQFKWDECTNTFKMNVSLDYTVFDTFAADSFGAASSPVPSPSDVDPLYGMRGIFKYEAKTAS